MISPDSVSLAYEEDIVDGAFIEDTEHIQNPVAPQGGHTAFGNCMCFMQIGSPIANKGAAPFLTPSTDHSMVGQTMRSFESRPGTSTRAKATADTALTRTGSSSTVVTFDDVAPSELEIYTQAGLLPPSKGEKVAAHRIRGDENEVRIAALLVAVQRYSAALGSSRPSSTPSTAKFSYASRILSRPPPRPREVPCPRRWPRSLIASTR
jgi:hypothetical protein